METEKDSAAISYCPPTRPRSNGMGQQEWVAFAGHELKTPVTSIKAYTELLQEKFEQGGDAKSSGLMTKLNKQVDSLTFLIRDLLDTTKIAEGKLQLHQEKFNMNDLIAEKIEELQRVSQKHEIIFTPQK